MENTNDAQIVFSGDIPQLTPPWERVPATTRVAAHLPDLLKEPMREQIRLLKGKAPCLYLRAASNLCEPVFASAPSEKDARYAARQIVAGFIEMARLDENAVDNPFFASLYRESVKANHCAAAESYIRANGGWQAVEGAMRAWMEEHRDELEDPAVMTGMPGCEINPETPEDAEASLRRFTVHAADVLNARGDVPPMFAVLNRDGRGIMFEAPPELQSSRERLKTFREMAARAGGEIVPDACRVVRAIEVWAAPADSGVRPSKSERREELVTLVVWDEEQGEEGRAASIKIERDESGKAYAGETRFDHGRAMATDFDD